MKKIILFFLFSFFLFSLQAQEPETQYTLRFDQDTWAEVFEKLEQETNYPVFYTPEWIGPQRISRSYESKSLNYILSDLLQGTRLKYLVYKNRIILSRDIAIVDELADGFLEKGTGSSDTSRTNGTAFTYEREIPRPEEGNQADTSQIMEVGDPSRFNEPGQVQLSGYIRDAENGESLAGVVVYADDGQPITTSDVNGYYSLRLEKGLHIIKTQFATMQAFSQEVQVYSSGSLDIDLRSKIVSLEQITIESERDVNIMGIEMGRYKIDIETMKNIPKVLGENDILLVMLSLPGVQKLGEGAAGFNVRGGAADQNLILLNESTIYNPSHFLGFFSIFNADVIKDAELFKGFIPADQGGRLSSIFEVNLKDGNKKKFSAEGGISPITSRMSFEIPLKENKTSLLLGGRTTYSDWVLNLVDDVSIQNSEASFYDVVARLSHKINDNNSLSLSGYLSRDRYKLSFDSLFRYRNLNASLQWQHRYNSKLQSELSATYSQYNYRVEFDAQPEEAFELGFLIREGNLKLDFNLFPGSRHQFNFGAQSKFYYLEPGFIENFGSESLISNRVLPTERGLESALYFSDLIEFGPRFSINLGLRYSMFNSLGARTVFQYDPSLPREEFAIVDTVRVDNLQAFQTYHGPEWRISGRYSLDELSSIKLSYNRTRQYIHLLSNTVSVAPTDTWKLSDNNIEPQIGDQISLGYYRNIKENTIEASLEIYYRWLQNTLDYKIGAELILNPNIETDVIQGRGKAYGLELLFRKRSGRLNGWLSYTYSRTLLQLDSPFPQERINQGQFFPANYDKPHDITLVSNYKLSRRYSFSFNFTYSTGRPITFPTGQYQLAGEQIILYSDRNDFRIPDYWRVDIGFNVEGNHKIKKLAHSFWTISIYNLFGRDNPYSVYFVAEEEGIQAYSLTIFGSPIPTISYNFKF